ncbi:MAG: SpoIIE family protein phosphatase [Clostridiales bacterium]|nr:SpoIIE family protein phosphatase [Clostridiales bacterium]
MLKQKVLAGAEGHSHDREIASREAHHSENSIAKQLVFMLVWALVGLFMPRASVYGGMAPFGVSFAAAVPGAGAALVYIFTMAGYLLPGGAVVPLRYAAALAAVAGIKWSLSGIKSAARHPLFSPIIAFLSIEATGLAMSAVNGLNAYSIFLTTAEGLLAGGSAYFFRSALTLIASDEPHGMLTAQQQASIVMTGAIVLMAATAFSFSGIAPGRIAAGVIILLLARCSKEQGGSIAGIVLGLAMAMTGTEYLYLAAAFSFGGLVAGIFARYGRFASAGAFMAANLISVITTGKDTAVIIGAYEMMASCLIFLVMPASVDRLINRFFVHSRDLPAVEGLRRSVVMRLDYASKAMKEVAQTVDAVSSKLAGLSAPDLGTVYRSVSDDVCRVCGLRMQCWDNQFNNTMQAFNELTPVLREKGAAVREDVPKALAHRCKRMDEVLRKINTGYLEYAVREGAWRRLSEIRGVVTDQFAGMSDMLDELSQDFSKTERVDSDAATRVVAVCEENGLTVQDAVCMLGRGGRMTVEILACDTGIRLNREKWQREIGDACGRELDHPVVTRLGDFIKIAMTEKPMFTVTSGSAQLQCTGERLCGDAYETFTDGSGRWYAVLSDGMGSGGRAAVDGAMASGLTSRLIQAGFGPDSVIRMVNSALMVKSGDESLATLDILSLDLFSGKIEFRKAGASPSLLCSMGRVSRIEKSSLPVGILRDIRAERSEDTLVDDDILLMCSDGVFSGGVEWVEERLRSFNAKSDSLRTLVEDISLTARRMQEEHEDDITVLAIQVKRRQYRSNAGNKRS